ncbi:MULTISPECIES: efflux RND transporter permease subunit [unclassified Thermoactinomyces]|uniref:efflux RND transporter permease subunit n=1 Tax=unclassified Thermoactinomyces TaxID=2634588 RepID=UPI0018DEA6E8|nr:efflux RND transporter permease subunit [Thermoactinomyces sp. CICC 10523]MBH8606323.1 efflux RND transporter permease subunit [Thermoactinomyces sp. CICC 10521]
MSWLTRFSLKNVSAIVLLVILVIGGGLYEASQLKMEAMPDIDFPVIVAITPYPGASPEDIDQKVTGPIEKEVMGVKGVQKVTSVSADSTSVVIAQFDFSADLDKAQQEMQDAIHRLKLPDGVMNTTFNRFGLNTYPLITLAVTSDKKNAADLERWVTDKAKPELETVDGVGEVQVKGEGAKAVYIRLKPDQLKKYNLSLQQVEQALQSADMSLPVGDLESGSVDMPIRINQKITNIDQLKNYELTVPANPGEGMQDAFNQIGQGMGQLGQAVGGLGQAVSGLGQAVNGLGQGMGQMSQGMAMLQMAQAKQAQVLGDQLELNKTLQQLQQNPDDAGLKAKAAELQRDIAINMAVLKQLSEKMKASGAGTKSKLSVPKLNMAGKPSLPSAKTKKPELKNPEIKTVKLGDIATITESADNNTMITRTDGKPSVNIDIIKNPDANVVDVATQVNKKIAGLKKANPDLHLIKLFDQSEGVKASIRSMIREGLLGALFASVVILLFLRKFRITLISIISIPISIFATIVLLKEADISLNIMTLGGIAVAVGRVVDDSIVVIENIYRHLMRKPERTSEIIYLATKEVGAAITSSTLTTVSVFIPLGFIDGIVGKVFYPFAVTVAIALLCSLLVAVTIVPVLSKIMLLRGTKMSEKRSHSRFASGYKKALAWSLRHKAIVLGGAVALLVLSLGLVPLVGTSFLPSEKEKAMQVNLKMPSGTDLEKTNEVTGKIEKTLKKHPEVEIISSSVGNLRGQLMSDGSIGSPNRASIFVKLADHTNMDPFLNQVRTELKPLGQQGEIEVNEVRSVGPPSSSISVSIQGSNMDQVKNVTEALTSRLKHVHGLTNVSNNLSASRQIVDVHVDEAKAARKGLVAQQVAYTIRGLLDADKVFEINNGPTAEDVRLGLEENDLNSLNRLKEIQILSQTGDLIKLGEIADVKVVSGPVSIQKQNGQRYATVSGDVTIKDTGAVSREVQSAINQVKIPKGISVRIGGDTEEMNKSFAQLGVAMVVAIAAVYIVMMISFGEATAPFTILFSLPFAVIGGLAGLWISGQPISVSAMIGALMLIGIVVTNAIVLIDRVKQVQARGLRIEEALLEAAGTRLRPILMTAFATIFALLPLGLGYGEGTLMSQGLAVVVIGGLTSSTFLTLFIVPIVYLLLTRIRERLIKVQA